VYSTRYSNISFINDSKVVLDGNKAVYGRVVHSISYSNIYVDGNALLTFADNTAQTGGANTVTGMLIFSSMETAL